MFVLVPPVGIGGLIVVCFPVVVLGSVAGVSSGKVLVVVAVVLLELVVLGMASVILELFSPLGIS